MRKLILPTLSTLALLIHPLSLSAQNSFSVSVDVVDDAAGDLAVNSVNVSADQNVTLNMRVELKLQVLTPDFNGDGVVNFLDFLAFASQFGTRQGDGKYDAKYDLSLIHI